MLIKCLALVAIFLGSANHVFAQQTTPRKIGWQIRVGAAAFTPLVKDSVRSRAVADSIDVDASGSVSVRQQIAPLIAIGALLPLRESMDLEVSAGFGTSSARGEDDFENWDVATVTFANLLLGISYAYRPTIRAHGGVGFTRLFGGDQGMFAEGNSIKPLVEAGASVVMPFNPAIQLDARVQTHRYSTQSLRDEAGDEGNVFRFVLTGSYTAGRSPR